MAFKDRLRQDVFSYLRARIFLGFLQLGVNLLLIGIIFLIVALVGGQKGNDSPQHSSLSEEMERSQTWGGKMMEEHSRVMENARSANALMRKNNEELRQRTQAVLDGIESEYKRGIREEKSSISSSKAE